MAVRRMEIEYDTVTIVVFPLIDQATVLPHHPGRPSHHPVTMTIDDLITLLQKLKAALAPTYSSATPP